MNNSQGKNGFKTFVVTLGLSLAVFGTAYYLITESTSEVDIEKEAAEISLRKSQEEVASYTAEQATAFEKLVSQEMDVPGKAVLAGATSTDETTQATQVPETGSNTAYALLASLTALTLGGYMFVYGPRRLALSGFEKKVLKNL